MANSFEIVRYKQLIMSALINNERIVALIGNNEVESPEDLVDENLFDYIRIPCAIEEEKTFIAFEVDVPRINRSNEEYLKKLVITFYVITHERLMRTQEGGTRIDILAAEIDKMFTGSQMFGTQPLEIMSNTANGVSVKHRCRILTFKAEDWIDTYCEDGRVR